MESYSRKSSSWNIKSELASLAGFDLPNVDDDLRICEEYEKSMRKSKK